MRKNSKILCLAEFPESDFILIFQLLTDLLLGPSFQDSGMKYKLHCTRMEKAFVAT